MIPYVYSTFLHLTIHYLLRAISSIRKIILTVSLASSIALVLTSKGCITPSPLSPTALPSPPMTPTPPLLILTPTFDSPFACLDLSSVTTRMAFSPAFSANVMGMTSSASANALKHIESGYDEVRASRAVSYTHLTLPTKRIV